MITLEKVKHEIHEMLEKGCLTSECIKDLTMLYYLEDKMEHGHKKMEHHEEHGKNVYHRSHYMDMPKAKAWVAGMRNADGSTGEHWTYDQTTQVMKQRNMECDPVQFYIAMNMMWSDYGKVAERYGVFNSDFFADMSKAFLTDNDAVPDKLTAYYEYLVMK